MKTMVLAATCLVVLLGVAQSHYEIDRLTSDDGGQIKVYKQGPITITEETTTVTTTTTVISKTIYIPMELKSYNWSHSIIVSRHSADSPKKFNAKNTVVKRSMFKRGAGCTTHKGLQWAYEAGNIYRKSFSKLVTDNNAKRCWARCSTHRASSESTTTMLSAWFPPDEGETINPIPVEKAPNGHDKFTATFGRNIPVDWSSVYHMSGIPGNRFSNIGEFMSYIRQQFDISDVNDYTIHEEFLKPIISARYENVQLPKWVIDNYEAIEWVVSRLTHYDTPYGSMIYPLYGRLLAKHLADKLETIMNRNSNDDVENVMSMLSYSSINIQALAYALNPNFGVWRPGYMGGLTMNVFRHPENTNDIQISMSLTNGLSPQNGDYSSMAMQGFKLFKIPGCGGNDEYCSLTNFTGILRRSYQNEFDDTQISCIGENAYV